MKNKQRLNELARFQAIAGVRSRNYLNEDDYSVPSNAISGDTAVDNIDEAGNIKGIKIEIPGNSYASDFGKAAAREVIASFTPMGAREFLEAFVEETKKIATARMAARAKAPTTAPVAPTPGMQAEGGRVKAGKDLFNKVLNSSSFTAFMDDGDWNYTRFGFGDVDGKCYMVEMESGYEDDRDVTELRSGLTTNMVVKAGVKKGFFEVGEDNFYSEDREDEMVNWLEGLYA